MHGRMRERELQRTEGNQEKEMKWVNQRKSQREGKKEKDSEINKDIKISRIMLDIVKEKRNKEIMNLLLLEIVVEKSERKRKKDRK